MKRLSLFLLAATPLLAPAARAVTTQFMEVSGFAELAAGEAQGLQLEADGTATLGPTLSKRAALGAAQAMAIIGDGAGGAFIATAQPAKLLQVDAKGAVRTVLQPKEPLCTALARDAKGALYVATATDGKVLRVDPSSGRSEVVLAAQAKYVWALLVESGRLYAATGVPGGLLRLDLKGSGTTLHLPKDKHIRSLAAGGEGAAHRFVAGSGHHGFVYRLDANDRATVLYDSSLEEISALSVGPDGTVYAAAVSLSEQAGSDDPEERSEVADQGGAREAHGREVKASEVVRIAPDGAVRLLWKSRKDGAYALAVDGDTLLIGTGGRGRLYRVRLSGNLPLALAGKVEAAEITAFNVAGGRTLLATSTPATLLALESATGAQGTLLTAPLDGKRSVRWGALQTMAQTPPGTSLRLAIRQGNTSPVDTTWGPFVDVTPGSAPQGLPASRYAQLRATLQGTGGATPRLVALGVALQGANRAPRLAKLQVLAPGVRIEAMPDDEPKGKTFSVSSSSFDEFRLEPGKPVQPAEGKARARQSYERGWRAASWEGEDDDGDRLSYDVELLGLDEQALFRIGTNLDRPFASFADERLADGRYRLRVRATDLSDNPLQAALTTELLSAPFVVDHSAPRLTRLRADVRPDGTVAVELAADDATILRGAWCAQDGGSWIALSASNGLSDETNESYAGTLPAPMGLAAQSSLVRCAVEDLVGNRGLGELRVR